MNRVIVLGSPGAGKSTFSRALAEITGLPLYHLDMIWHRPDRTNVSREEFDRKLAEILRYDRWIIDGNYNRTIPVRLEKCDTVFLMDFPVEVCLEGAAERVGKKRPDMPWVEQELDAEFEQFIRDFPKDFLPNIREQLAQCGKKVTVFHSRDEADEYLASAGKNCIPCETYRTDKGIKKYENEKKKAP